MESLVADHERGATVAVRVVPRARRTELVGRRGEALKVKLAAPPVDGAANAELVKFVARLVGVHKRDVSILAGATSRDKVVLVEGVDAWRLRSVLEELVD
jgi:hypothetical protein